MESFSFSFFSDHLLFDKNSTNFRMLILYSEPLQHSMITPNRVGWLVIYLFVCLFIFVESLGFSIQGTMILCPFRRGDKRRVRRFSLEISLVVYFSGPDEIGGGGYLGLQW